MSTSKEISVDPELEKFLSSTPTLTSTVAAQVEDEDLVADEEKIEPCSPNQRQTIFSLLHTQGLLDSEPSKMASVIKNIKNLNSEEAEVYTEGLQCHNSLNFSKELTKRLLKVINHFFISKEDEETKKHIENDGLLLDALNLNLTNLFSRLGRVKPFVIYGLYLSSGFILLKKSTHIEKLNDSATSGYNVGTTLQTDGGS